MTKILFSILLILKFSFSISAQINKPNLFADTTSLYKLSQNDLQQIFDAKKNGLTYLSLPIIGNINIAVNMNEWNDVNTHSVGGKIMDYNETFISITTFTNKGKYYLQGNIFSKIENKAFKIYLADDGNVYIERVNKNQIIVE